MEANKTRSITWKEVLPADSNANPVSILYKSTEGRYRPVRVAIGPITARCRFIKNASWEITGIWVLFHVLRGNIDARIYFLYTHLHYHFLRRWYLHLKYKQTRNVNKQRLLDTPRPETKKERMDERTTWKQYTGMNIKMGHVEQKGVFEHALNAQIPIHPTHVQSHPGICSLLIHSIASNDSLSGPDINVNFITCQ